MGLGAFLCFEHFCFFFRSLALVFQKSPTRNKEATRFTLIVTIRYRFRGASKASQLQNLSGYRLSPSAARLLLSRIGGIKTGD